MLKPYSVDLSDDIFLHISSNIQQKGYLVLNEVFSIEQLNQVFIDIKKTARQDFHSAGIGREQEHQVNRFVRGDRIHWLDKNHEPVSFYYNWMEQLRMHLNRELFLGLFDYECHYAHYPQGTFYKKHVDAFRGASNRRLTTILYLNPSWQTDNGGELVMYKEGGKTVLEKVSPVFGMMVIFLSEEFPHEVLPAKKSRYSLTGWFRVNTMNSNNLSLSR